MNEQNWTPPADQQNAPVHNQTTNQPGTQQAQNVQQSQQEPHREQQQSQPGQQQPEFKDPVNQEDQANANAMLQDETGREIVAAPATRGLQVIDLDNLADLPDLNDCDELPIDLSVEYWTPERPGEARRMVFTGVNIRQTLDSETAEVHTLPCAFFLYKTPDGDIRTVCNASKRLVGAMENNNIRPGTPVNVQYIGKQKNKTNAFQSDQWSIKPLMIKIG